MGYSVKTIRYHYVEWYYWDNEAEERGAYVTNELYDSKADPDENINIAGIEENNEIIIELSNQLLDGWLGLQIIMGTWTSILKLVCLHQPLCSPNFQP